MYVELFIGVTKSYVRHKFLPKSYICGSFFPWDFIVVKGVERVFSARIYFRGLSIFFYGINIRDFCLPSMKTR